MCVGLPTATSLEVIWKNGKVVEGHSLGSLDAMNLKSAGFIENKVSVYGFNWNISRYNCICTLSRSY
jgi:hypothetical protein